MELLKRLHQEHILLSSVVLGMFLTNVCGCGGNANTGDVTGKITLDGQPLAGAEAVFAPAAGGGMSTGTTGSDGVYTLTHMSGTSGAVIGQHTVSVTTARETETTDENGEQVTIATEERVPAKYNDNSTLTADVVTGTNTCDFYLTTE